MVKAQQVQPGQIAVAPGVLPAGFDVGQLLMTLMPLITLMMVFMMIMPLMRTLAEAFRAR